ncbi:MAG: ABC transporter ATP-binding protein [Hyphomicrobiaceae bacterium]
MLKVDHLRVGALSPVSFALAAGQCLVVSGASGTGKTRLLRAIADLDPAEGTVMLEGAERGEMPGPAWRKLVRYVSSEPGWWAATARPHFAADLAAVIPLIEALGLSGDILDRPLAELSTGERLRLGLIRAVCGRPKALLLDEPFSSLDRAAAGRVEALIGAELDLGRIVVVVSHQPAAILSRARAELIIEAGTFRLVPHAVPRVAWSEGGMGHIGARRA